MKSTIRFTFSLIILLACGGQAARASFELERPGARASGMAGAFTAVADDADALYYNPAGLMDIPQESISAEFSRLLTGLDTDTPTESRLAYIMPIKNLGCLGLAWHQRSLAAVYQENVILAGLGFALDKEEKYKLGAGLKILQAGYQDGDALSANSDFFAQSSTVMGITFDVGGKVDFGEGMTAGVGVANITQPDVSLKGGYALPIHIRVGAAYAYENGVSALDLLAYQGNQRLAAGTEYWWFDQVLGTRLGMGFGNAGMMEITAGLSLKVQFVGQLDYAYVNPLGDFAGLGGTHRVNVSIILGAPPLDPGTLQGLQLKAKGDEAMKQGNWAEAVDDYEQAAEYLPQDTEITAKINTLHEKQKKVSEINLYLKQGKDFKKNGSYQNALAVYQKVLTLDPNHAEALAQAAELQAVLQKMTEAQRLQQEQQERLAAEKTRQEGLKAAKDSLQAALRALEKARRNSEIRRLLAADLSRLEKQWGAANQLWRSGEAERAQVGAQDVMAELEKLYRKAQRKQVREKRDKLAAESLKRESAEPAAESSAPPASAAAMSVPTVGKASTAERPVKPLVDEAQRRRARGAYGRTVKLMLDIDKLQGKRYFADAYSSLQSEISRIKILINSEDYAAAVEYAEGVFPKLEALKSRCEDKKKAREVMPTNW
jgi:tetratricopeptide (TPR) repeat protein